jgi:hypothetical protein
MALRTMEAPALTEPAVAEEFCPGIGSMGGPPPRASTRNGEVSARATVARAEKRLAHVPIKRIWRLGMMRIVVSRRNGFSCLPTQEPDGPKL